MRKMLIAGAVFCAGAGLGGGAALAGRTAGEADYARLLSGKVAGKPQSCLDTNHLSAQLSAYGDKLVYRVSRSLVYVNQTTGGCEPVARGDALISDRTQSQSCHGDVARTVDIRGGGLQTGTCSLGDFVPYRSR